MTRVKKVYWKPGVINDSRMKKERDDVPLLMFSQRNNPYCELLQICSAKIVLIFENSK